MWGIICIAIILFFLIGPKKNKTSSPDEPEENIKISEQENSSTVSEPKDSSTVSEPEDSSTASGPEDRSTVSGPEDSSTVSGPEDSSTVSGPEDSSTVSEQEDSRAVPEQEDSSKQKEPAELDLQNAYQKKWLFTYNEKNAFWKLKEIAEKNGYLVFAKVRLIDLVEPTRGNPKYKTFFYKVQAKHVDFVLCDQKLVARIIVELDDSSHERADRAERDNFVDSILRNTGYKVIRVRAISDNILDEIK